MPVKSVVPERLLVSLGRLWRLSAVALFCRTVLLAEAGIDTTNLVSRFDAAFAPGLVAEAARLQIPLEGVGHLSPGKLQPGDSLTAVVTLSEPKNQRSQWLLFVRVVEPDEKERLKTTPDPLVLYSGSNERFEFTPKFAFATLRTIGPFLNPENRGKPPKVRDVQARFALNEGFLSLGLDDAAAAVARLKDQKERGSISIGPKPFSPEEAEKSKAQANRLQLSVPEQRALAGAIPGLMSYFELVQHTEGLRDIMFRIIDLPSVWSMIWHGGVRAGMFFEPANLTQGDPRDWRIPDSPRVFHLPMLVRLNDDPALDVVMVVTSPKPPLLLCGGVIGMIAQPPGNPSKWMTLRVVSARLSEPRP
jgi:hypothetical protein